MDKDKLVEQMRTMAWLTKCGWHWASLTPLGLDVPAALRSHAPK